jgi:hypothetical protein
MKYRIVSLYLYRLWSEVAFREQGTCRCFRLSKSGSAEQVALLQNAIERKVPIMIEFLSNDYDDVSTAVLEFAKEYIHVSIIGYTFLIF